MRGWPEEVIAWLRENVPGRTTKQVTELINQQGFDKKYGMVFSDAVIKNAKNRYGIKSGTAGGFPKGYSLKYPEGMESYIRSIAAGRKTKEIAELVSAHFGIEFSEKQCRAYKKNHDIISGVDCRFDKGHVPANKGILKEAANTRKAFIEGILSGRIKKVTNEEKVVAELFEQMMSWETFTGHNTLKEFFLGDKCYNAQKEDVEAAEKKMEGLSVLHKLLCMVSAMVADADLVDWNYTYSTGKGEKTKAFYKVLELYGFQYPNDEEKGVVEGTSDLYVKKEGAK